MLLDSSERNLVVEAFRSGASGVFSRDDFFELLARCVEKVREGSFGQQSAAQIRHGTSRKSFAWSEHAVRNYLFRIYNKLRVRTRLELAVFARNQRDISQPKLFPNN